jgi:hypothetical protein
MLSLIRARLNIDALDAYRKSFFAKGGVERGIHDFEILESSVVSTPMGFKGTVLLKIKSTFFVVSNTTLDRMELEYDEAGNLTNFSRENITEANFSFRRPW